jgi:hypothetical protein
MINIAKLIYENFPDAKDLIPEECSEDLKQMYRYVVDAPTSELGDSLLRFIVIEAWEGGQLSDGTVDPESVCHALGRGAEEMEQVLGALAAAIAQDQEG